MKKGQWIGGTAVVLILAGGVATVWYLVTFAYNPYFEGKRLYAWKDQAIHDPDPAARTRATDVLIRAFREQGDETRTQLVLKCCYQRNNTRGEPELPSEIVPFLIETLHDRRIPAGSYPSIALAQVEGEEAIPAIMEVILHDEDENAREGAIAALIQMGPHAESAVKMLR